jgi:hypothetical protein
MPSTQLFVAYQRIGSNTWVQILDGTVWTGSNGATGFQFIPNSDFMPPVMDGSYKLEACDGSVCVIFDMSIGSNAVIFSSSVTGNPCLYPPTYNPTLANGGPFVQFSGNIVMPPAQAYLQALACGFPAWNYSWAPWEFINYWGFDYYDYNYWAPWAWGVYDPYVWYPWLPVQNVNPVTMQPWVIAGYDPSYLPIISSPRPTIYNQGMAQVLGTSIQYPVNIYGQALPALPGYYGR